MLDTSTANTHTQIDNGPAIQVQQALADIGLAATGGASARVLSGGYTKFAFGVTSATAGNVTAQRYLDAAGLVPQGPALTAALTAGTPGVLNCIDGVPFQSVVFTVAGNLTNVALLWQA